jgi:iron complex outermembrane receptor protein
MRRLVLTVLTFFLGFSLGSQVLYAQEADQKEKGAEFELEEVVVTATKTPTTVREAPASVTVVTSEDLEKKNVKNLDSALRNEVGLFDRRGKGMTETVTNVQMRGFTGPERTLILFDGQPLNTGYTASVNWNVLPVEDVERVEIVRGPFSSLYGRYAMGGVINVIPKVPEKLEIKGKVGYGTDDTTRYFLSVGDRFLDRISLYFSYDQNSTNGYAPEMVTKTATANTGTIEVDDPREIRNKYGDDNVYLIGDKGDNWYGQQTYSLRGRWDITQATQLSLGYTHGWYRYGYDEYHVRLKTKDGTKIDDSAGKYVYFPDDEGYWRFKVSPYDFLNGSGARTTEIYNASLEQKFWDRGRVKLSLGLTDEPDNWYTLPTTGATFEGGPGTVSESPNRMVQLELQSDIPIGKQNLLTAGICYNYDRTRNREWLLEDWNHKTSKTELQSKAEGKNRIWGFYLQDKIEYPPHFTLYVGGRVDRWKAYDGRSETVSSSEDYSPAKVDSFSPKLAIVYHPFFDPVDTVFRFAAGKAFRYPTVYELYRTWRSTSGSTYEGNPDLNPEKTKSWEVGADLMVWKRLNLKLTYFENYIDNLIYNATISDSPLVVRKMNAARGLTRGAEAEVRIQATSFLDLFANGTYLNAKIIDNPDNPKSENQQVPYVPRRMATLGADFHYWTLKASFAGHYASKVFTIDDNSDRATGVPGSWDSYWVWDAKIGWDFCKWGNISFAVNNVFDREYYQSYLAPGRKVFTELTLRY